VLGTAVGTERGSASLFGLGILYLMGNVELTEALLGKLAGWQVVKHARGLVAAGRALECDWQPPLERVGPGRAFHLPGWIDHPERF